VHGWCGCAVGEAAGVAIVVDLFGYAFLFTDNKCSVHTPLDKIKKLYFVNFEFAP
jgi:hypothetical protein